MEEQKRKKLYIINNYMKKKQIQAPFQYEIR